MLQKMPKWKKEPFCSKFFFLLFAGNSTVQCLRKKQKQKISNGGKFEIKEMPFGLKKHIWVKYKVKSLTD
jgi:hypothetical protein